MHKIFLIRSTSVMYRKFYKNLASTNADNETFCTVLLTRQVVIVQSLHPKRSLLFCQPRVEVTLCFVYKVIGLTLHDRINTQLIYIIEIAEVVARRITKPQRTFSRFESHWLLFFIHFFYYLFGGGGGRSDFIILFMSYFFFFLLIFYYFLFSIPLTCIRYIYKNFCNNRSYCKFGNTREYER